MFPFTFILFLWVGRTSVAGSFLGSFMKRGINAANSTQDFSRTIPQSPPRIVESGIKTGDPASSTVSLLEYGCIPSEAADELAKVEGKLTFNQSACNNEFISDLEQGLACAALTPLSLVHLTVTCNDAAIFDFSLDMDKSTAENFADSLRLNFTSVLQNVTFTPYEIEVRTSVSGLSETDNIENRSDGSGGGISLSVGGIAGIAASALLLAAVGCCAALYAWGYTGNSSGSRVVICCCTC
mmetsp:Transcript_6479/g.8946  ORF Transcript_6479/g.8946 Transcript_6479/m.8946 type:complete len:240 (-) Transcript_6479:374-1093(-)